MHQGELLVSSQTKSVDGLMSRATSILGWSVTISLALAGAIGSIAHIGSYTGPITAALTGPILLPLTLTLLIMLCSAFACLPVLFPAKWRTAGHEPGWLLQQPFPTELETLESMASGYAEAAEWNSKQLTRLEWWLRAAWTFFYGAPWTGILSYFALGYWGK